MGTAATGCPGVWLAGLVQSGSGHMVDVHDMLRVRCSQAEALRAQVGRGGERHVCFLLKSCVYFY
eukprot:jgi/Bigna1/64935/fgenesh1_kg.90_\